MAKSEPVEPPDSFIHGWRLSPRIFKKPEHIHDVLKRFGPRRRSTLRRITQELDMVGTDYPIAQKSKPPLKFADAGPKLERFENFLLNGKAQWNGLRPLLPTFVTQRLRMVPRSERKQKADAAMATIDFGLVATTLLRIIRKVRDPKRYSALVRQPRSKSHERTYLWDPLLRLMKKYHVKPGQHGSFLGAIKSLHLALGIDPPSEGAVKKMLHDLRRSDRSKGNGQKATQVRIEG